MGGGGQKVQTYNDKIKVSPGDVTFSVVTIISTV